MKLQSLRDLLVEQLQDLYDAEHRITKALPKMAKAATSPDLKAAFKKHLGRQGGYNLSSVVAKKQFLYCYHKAQIEVLIELNIHLGWQAISL